MTAHDWGFDPCSQGGIWKCQRQGCDVYVCSPPWTRQMAEEQYPECKAALKFPADVSDWRRGFWMREGWMLRLRDENCSEVSEQKLTVREWDSRDTPKLNYNYTLPPEAKDLLEESKKVLAKLQLKEATCDEAGVAALVVEACKHYKPWALEVTRETSYENSSIVVTYRVGVRIPPVKVKDVSE